ncbi:MULTISPECIES: energy-coupling factor transporter transmembrane component T family protein [unclassified Butyrivibrio]|uniref:energy-coupling factor transporter transmembrane component T family protein n=1 Tax=unclassified Butyrivibrio TaxID=2639466 RepID=UPI0003F51211|nr:MULTISPECIES: energy-coupling factor transporter transmembrane component T [unclassified Butyrivibrio]SEL42479.1 energy-coupling factor transport system permease protein [Butyrivibrio sp. ob235]
MNNLFNYIERESPIHELTGATKLVCLLLWSLAAMTTYDTRLLAVMSVLGVALFPVGRIKLKDVTFMLVFTLVYLALSTTLVYLFSPRHGCGVYGSTTLLFGLSGYFAPTAEQLFFQLNYILKYFATIPFVLLFVCTTNPSEFAASLNKIGVPYSVAYSVALALRYIPDIQKQYHEISQASQARGIELSKKASLISRLKSASSILIPLVLSSMDRIEVIANAMELRCFGKNKKRTWYMERKFRWIDYLCIVVCALLLVASITLTHINGSRFYNPFL